MHKCKFCFSLYNIATIIDQSPDEFMHKLIIVDQI